MIVPRWLSFVCALAHLTFLLAFDDFENWHCGSDLNSKRYSFDLFGLDCPASKASINHCCVIHDDCYVKQLGQDRCDTEFCECNKRALTLTNGSKCTDHVQLICLMMPIVGGIAYSESVNWTEPFDLKLHTVQGSLTQLYSQLYANCTDQNTTLSSCAHNFNQCQKTDFFCSLDLIYCISDVGSKSSYTNCLYEVTEMITFLRKELALFSLHPTVNSVNSKVVTFLTLNNFSLMVMCVLATLCVILLLMMIYRTYLRRQEKDLKDGIKYAPVV